MAVRQLSPELVSLIHHVELNESGWWRKAVGQMVRAVLWKRGSPATVAELREALRTDADVSLAESVLARQLELLQGQGIVVKMPGPNYKLTERASDDLTQAHTRATEEQEQCKSHFVAACHQHCTELPADKVWTEFTKALQSAVRVTGANLFHLIADGQLERDVDWLAEFLKKFPSEHREGLRVVLKGFFARDNKACRNQVLRLLNAHFFAEASQLRPETLDLIEGKNKKHTIKVVLDTNFIFSALKLHDNPGDESALSLIDVARRSSKYLDIRLFVLPDTLDEAKLALLDHMRRSDRIRTTAAMTSAALMHPLPSIVRKFLNAAAKSPGLTASAYFKPYIDDLRTVLKDKGVSVLEAHPAIYRTRQDVIDDILDEMHREEQELPESKRKGYDKLAHDMVLWHVVKDRRPTTTDSPFEVEYWAVSMDWRLIHFDRQKRSNKETSLPIVLHASNLVQLVQFWVPRSSELDDSLVDTLRLPLLFESFSPEDEEATVKVLTAISRFENLDDLPESTVKSLLANQALRARLTDSDAANDRAFELVRDELLSLHKGITAALDETIGSLNSTRENLNEERIQRNQSEWALREANQQLAAADIRAKEAELRADEAEKARLSHEQAMAIKLRDSQVLADRARTSILRAKYVTGALVVPAGVGLGLGAWAHSVLPTLLTGTASLSTVGVIAASTAVGLCPLALSCATSPYITQRYPSLQYWWVSSSLNFAGKWLVTAPVTLTVTAVFQSGMWETLKGFLGFA